MNIIAILAGILFTAISILFWLDKAPKRWINFDRLNKELDVKLIRRAIGLVLLIVSGIFFLTGFSAVFRQKYFLAAIIGSMILMALIIIATEKSKLFHKNK